MQLQLGDTVITTSKGFLSDETDGKGENHSLGIRFRFIPGFEDQLVGSNERRWSKVTFPEESAENLKVKKQYSKVRNSKLKITQN